MVDVSKTYPNPVNIDALLETVRAQYPQVSQGDTGFRVHQIAPENVGTVSAALDAIIAAHSAATLTPTQKELTQADTAKTALKNLISGLHELSVQDKGYVVLGRIMARNDGANNTTIMSITTRVQAQAYVTSRANWLAVPSAARPMLGDILEAQAVSLSVLIALLA